MVRVSFVDNIASRSSFYRMIEFISNFTYLPRCLRLLRIWIVAVIFMYIYGKASVALWRQKLSGVSKAPDLNKPGLGADSRE